MQRPPAERGLLSGLPIPIKDLTNVAGVRNTQGSPIYKDTVAARSDIVVELLESNGGVIYAKSNAPEFGAGAHTLGSGPAPHPKAPPSRLAMAIHAPGSPGSGDAGSPGSLGDSSGRASDRKD